MPDPFAPPPPSTHRERPPFCGNRDGESRCDLYRDHRSENHHDSHRHTSWPVTEGAPA